MANNYIQVSQQFFEAWVDGISLIERKLRVSLEGQGLFPIKAMDEPFDPKFHEAATYGKGKEGIIIEELQKGYKLYDRILRPAVVVVGQGDVEVTGEIEKENNI